MTFGTDSEGHGGLPLARLHPALLEPMRSEGRAGHVPLPRTVSLALYAADDGSALDGDPFAAATVPTRVGALISGSGPGERAFR
jgi:hypothetical protein